MLVVCFHFPALAVETNYQCDEHTYSLKIEEIGGEHVNHVLKLNNSVPIEEIHSENWFVEEVLCLTQGFKIIASHRQYNDPRRKEFILKIINQDRYELHHFWNELPPLPSHFSVLSLKKQGEQFIAENGYTKAQPGKDIYLGMWDGDLCIDGDCKNIDYEKLRDRRYDTLKPNSVGYYLGNDFILMLFDYTSESTSSYRCIMMDLDGTNKRFSHQDCLVSDQLIEFPNR